MGKWILFGFVFCSLLVFVSCQDSQSSIGVFGAPAFNQSSSQCDESYDSSIIVDDDTNLLPNEDECEEELFLDWDGSLLQVQHNCVSFNCSFNFYSTYIQNDNLLELREYNLSDAQAMCSCNYDLAYTIPAEPGTYRLRLIVTWNAGDRNIHYTEEIELPDGESRSYSF